MNLFYQISFVPHQLMREVVLNTLLCFSAVTLHCVFGALSLKMAEEIPKDLDKVCLNA